MKYILTIIGVVSVLLIVSLDVFAYLRDEYEPVKGDRRKIIGQIAQLGFILPLGYFSCFIKSYVYSYVYYTSLISIICIAHSILNIKRYLKNRRKGLLIESVLLNLFLILLVAGGYFVYFK